MRIGFIGLGNMGSAMAANLIKAGHDVTAYNRSRAKVDALAAEGARPAASIAEACDGDMVISMLANDEAVAGVTFGDEGIVASLARGATHVSSSTISVALSERIDRGARRGGPAVRRRTGVRQAGGGAGGEAVRRGRGRPRGAASDIGGARRRRPTHVRRVRGARRPPTWSS